MSWYPPCSWFLHSIKLTVDRYRWNVLCFLSLFFSACFITCYTPDCFLFSFSFPHQILSLLVMVILSYLSLLPWPDLASGDGSYVLLLLMCPVPCIIWYDTRYGEFWAAKSQISLYFNWIGLGFGMQFCCCIYSFILNNLSELFQAENIFWVPVYF